MQGKPSKVGCRASQAKPGAACQLNGTPILGRIKLTRRCSAVMGAAIS
jgi:hypothetical protein